MPPVVLRHAIPQHVKFLFLESLSGKVDKVELKKLAELKFRPSFVTNVAGGEIESFSQMPRAVFFTEVQLSIVLAEPATKAPFCNVLGVNWIALCPLSHSRGETAVTQSYRQLFWAEVSEHRLVERTRPSGGCAGEAGLASFNLAVIFFGMKAEISG